MGGTRFGTPIQIVGECGCGCGKKLYNEGRMWKQQRYYNNKCRDRQQARNRLNRRKPERERRGNYAPKQ